MMRHIYKALGNPYKAGAIVIWVAGLSTTTVFIQQLGVPWPGFITIIIATVLQLGFTLFQRLFWNGVDWPLGLLALILDGFVNLGGTMAVAEGLRSTASVQALGDPGAGRGFVNVIAIMLAILLAVGPERAWMAGERWAFAQLQRVRKP